MNTFNGIQGGVFNPLGALNVNPFAPAPGGGLFGNPVAPIKKGRKKNIPINPAFAFGGGNVNGRRPTILKIEKIKNCVLYEKFINEFKRMLRKYP